MSDVDSELMAGLARMLAAGQQRRAARAQTALETLRSYERRILREAAVMGYVLGYQSGNLDGRTGIGGPLDKNNRIPPDSEILRRVIEHCDSTDDLYPFLAAACDRRRRSITKARRWPGEAGAR
ncbi:hypothetical protein ACIA5D_17750 [Actinoplanes sp. NPDC051513]|uniref:hypothetical protein n=1 Tax=Actinoplanes sp. NPDC051513 TaxID=3363908 RepID=UPI0037AB91AB